MQGFRLSGWFLLLEPHGRGGGHSCRAPGREKGGKKRHRDDPERRGKELSRRIVQLDGPAEEGLIYDPRKNHRQCPARGQPAQCRGEADKGGLREEYSQHLRPRRSDGAQDADFAFAFDYQRAERKQHPGDSYDDGDRAEDGGDRKGLVKDVEYTLAERSIVVNGKLALPAKSIAKCLDNDVCVLRVPQLQREGMHLLFLPIAFKQSSGH